MQLRKVDPRLLLEDPNNPRRSPVHQAYEDQLLAAIIATDGPVQPPVIRERAGELFIDVGHRRVRASINAGLAEIYVLQVDTDDKQKVMSQVVENVARQGLNTVDTWRSMEALVGAGWTEEAVATALNLLPRVVKRLRLCGGIHNAVLDQMAMGDEPNERELRIIASTPREQQAEAWKKFKPKKGERALWAAYARALDRRRLYARDASFTDEIARAHGIAWSEDLFEQDDKDNRFTDQVDDYLNAQHEWMEANLPKKGVVLTVGDDGNPKLPSKAMRNWGTPKKSDTIGRYVDPHSGKIVSIAYTVPTERAVSNGKTGKAAAGADAEAAAQPAKTRPPVTQEGLRRIGDMQTDALHKAFAEDPIDDLTLIGLLLLALAGKNVEVRTSVANDELRFNGRAILAGRISEGGALTADPETIRKAARDALQVTLGLRTTNYGGNSGLVARIAGATVNADRHLGGMATEEFLSCLSKAEIEAVASANGVLPKPTGKATRAAVLAQFKDGDYVYPGAKFGLDATELDAHASAGNPRTYSFDTNDDEADESGEPGRPAPLDEDEAG